MNKTTIHSYKNPPETKINTFFIHNLETIEQPHSPPSRKHFNSPSHKRLKIIPKHIQTQFKSHTTQKRAEISFKTHPTSTTELMERNRATARHFQYSHPAKPPSLMNKKIVWWDRGTRASLIKCPRPRWIKHFGLSIIICSDGPLYIRPVYKLSAELQPSNKFKNNNVSRHRVSGVGCRFSLDDLIMGLRVGFGGAMLIFGRCSRMICC